MGNMACARVYRRQTHFPSREALQHGACCPRASPPRTVLLSIILRAARGALCLRALPTTSKLSCQRTMARMATAKCTSADSVQSARESRLLQASASGRRQQRALLYFTSLESHLCRLQGRRDKTAMLPAVLLPSSSLTSAAVCKAKCPACAVYGKLAVHAEYWRHLSLPASLTQTVPLGCSQTAVSVVNHTAGSPPSQHVVAVLPTKPVHFQLLVVSFLPAELQSCHPNP
jgi:hypothetical protein